jgi:hypothetical protein
MSSTITHEEKHGPHSNDSEADRDVALIDVASARSEVAFRRLASLARLAAAFKSPASLTANRAAI